MIDHGLREHSGDTRGPIDGTITPGGTTRDEDTLVERSDAVKAGVG